MLVGLLVLLATLQYRWLGRVSEAERERMTSGLETAVRRFADDFDEEIARLFAAFVPDPRASSSAGIGAREHLLASFRAWEEDAARPGLVEQVYFVGTDSGSSLDVERLNPERSLLERVSNEERGALPLVGLEERLSLGTALMDRGGAIPMLIEDPPGLVAPLMRFQRRQRRLIPKLEGYAIVTLDLDYLTTSFLPELVERHFATGGTLDYDVRVRSRESNELVYRSSDAEIFGSPDVSISLFSMMGLRRGRGAWMDSSLRTPRWRRRPPDQRSREEAFRVERRPRQGAGGSFREALAELGEPKWELSVRHRAGSLDAAVRGARNRNLAVSFGILGLLGVAIAMILASTRRSLELSRQRVELVAGVSHEFRTPLAVIRSAGQNLADGSVEEPERVKHYGALIEKEGLRLTDLVEKVLELAGIQSHRKRLERGNVVLAHLVHQALEDNQPAVDALGAEVETSLPEGPVCIRTDGKALRHALSNLISNALKHGDEPWIGIAVDVDRGGAVRLSVRDRGTGIDERDLPHIFEPFYRGSATSEVAGSGLGLSLVQHIVEELGGRVEVTTRNRDGSTFTIVLPGAAVAGTPGVER